MPETWGEWVSAWSETPTPWHAIGQPVWPAIDTHYDSLTDAWEALR